MVEIEQFDSVRLELNVKFDNPNLITLSESSADFLFLTFKDPGKFIDERYFQELENF